MPKRGSGSHTDKVVEAALAWRDNKVLSELWVIPQEQALAQAVDNLRAARKAAEPATHTEGLGHGEVHVHDAAAHGRPLPRSQQAGDMHEPPPYRGELDWPPLVTGDDD